MHASLRSPESPAPGQKIYFSDGHTQEITSIDRLEETSIIWLKRGHPIHPDWVEYEQVGWSPQLGAWVYYE